MKPYRITIHHEAGNSSFESVNEYHKQKWNSVSSLGFYCGYHYYIDKNGKLFQARKDDEIGIHTRDNNTGNIGICLEGNFILEKPTELQFISLDKLIDRLKMTYGITKIYGHKDFNLTECPGANLMKWVNLKKQLSFLQRAVLLLKQKLGLMS